MRYRTLLILAALLAAPLAHAAPSVDARREIAQLISSLDGSQCRFQRNGSWYDGLPEKDRQAVDAAVKEANELNREDVEKRVDERIQFLADQGMQVIEPTPEEMQAFRDKGQPAYIDWLEEEGIGDQWIEMALEDAGQSDLLAD